MAARFNLSTASTDGAEGARHDPELAALWELVRDDPDDLERFFVLGDWLQSRGDPRGALIALDCSVEAGGATPEVRDARESLLSEHADQLLGSLAAAEAHGHLALTWRRGFIRAAAVRKKRGDRADPSRVVRTLVAHPSAALLHTLQLDWVDASGSYDAALAALATAPRVPLRRLVIGDMTGGRDPFAMNARLDPVWSSCPELRELVVHGDRVELGLPRSWQLERLTVRSPRPTAVQLAEVTDHLGPGTRHLELWLGAQFPQRREALSRIAKWPALRSLGLRNTYRTDQLCRWLARSSLLGRLRRLDLAMGTMTEVGAQVLLDHHAAFARLEHLGLDHNFLPERAVGLLRRRFGTAVVNPKHQRNVRRSVRAPLFTPR